MRKSVLLSLTLSTLIFAPPSFSYLYGAEESPVATARELLVVPSANCVRRAFIVGVSKYDQYKDRLNPLEGVANDTAAYKDQFLAMNFEEENIVVLSVASDVSPTKQNIADALSEFLGKCGKDDVVFVVLGGHGFHSEDAATDKGGADYLIPQDGKWTVKDKECIFDVESCLSIDNIKAQLSANDARFKCLIVDACRSSSETTTRGAEGPNWVPAGEIDAAKGMVVLQSGSMDQVSYERPFDGMKRGLFSYYLIQAWQCQVPEAKAANSKITV